MESKGDDLIKNEVFMLNNNLNSDINSIKMDFFLIGLHFIKGFAQEISIIYS